MTLRFEVFARTEVGCARERNEDAFCVVDLTSGTSGIWPNERVRIADAPGTVVGVCDGMGGAAAGDVASKMAASVLEEVMHRWAPLTDVEHAERALLDAVGTANREIAQYTKAHPDKRGMGTTMTAATIFGPDLVLVQVGDSRAYLRRGQQLQQLTVDQNLVGQMIASGRITPEEARNVKQRNMLLEAIGVQERVGPDLVRVRVQPGDVLMLCSDGLTGPLHDRQVLGLMLKHEDPVRCCRALTEAACAAGGPDNVTVAIARFLLDDGAPPPDFNVPIASHRRNAVA